jgi:DNA-binding transcriptional ArsR family regulator
MHDTLDSTFSALSDATRRAILARLANGDATVNELAQPFKMSLPAVSKHLKVLERAGLIVRGRDAQRRPCHLAPGPLKEIAAFAERYRRHWEESFDRLDEHLETMKRTGKKHSAKNRNDADTRTK